MNIRIISFTAIISLLIATDLIIHKTDGDSLNISLSQIDRITFSIISETTSQAGVIHKIDGDSLTVPLSQIEKITFSTVSGTTPPEGVIEIFAGDDIQSIVDANPVGSTYILKSGLHRMQKIFPQEGDTYIGEDGTILNGSRLLTEFEQEGGLYYAPDQTQQGGDHGDPNVCPEGWERCDYPEVLYIDDEPLRHMTSLEDVVSGSYFFDYDAERIYFADEPDGKKVETSITDFAFFFSASHVTIKNIIVEKYANHTDWGAVGGDQITGWLIEGCEIRLNHGAGIVVGGESIVRGNYLHHNGHVGVNAGSGSNILIESNEISYNNFTRVSMGWGGAATKFYLSDNLQVIGNYVHHNFGHGLWTDIENTNTLYEGNWVWWNVGMGITHEISHNVIIRNNDIRYNGINDDIWLWGSQILIHVSDGAEVYNNTIYIHPDGGNGIGIMNYNRPSDTFGDFYGKDNYIHHNEITHLGLWGINGIADEANNLFDYNNYHHNGIPEKFELCETWYLTWEQFRAAGQEPNGTMDSNVVIPDDTPPKVCAICPGL